MHDSGMEMNVFQDEAFALRQNCNEEEKLAIDVSLVVKAAC